MNTIKSFLLITLLSSLIGCQQQANSQAEEPKTESKELTEKKQELKAMTFQGTIRHMKLEGGFYGIVTVDGKKLLPQNLADEHRVDGTVVEFSGEFIDVMTIQQWGKPFTISNIKVLKKGENKSSKSEI
jgi:hypothetical protein